MATGREHRSSAANSGGQSKWLRTTCYRTITLNTATQHASLDIPQAKVHRAEQPTPQATAMIPKDAAEAEQRLELEHPTRKGAQYRELLPLRQEHIRHGDQEQPEEQYRA